MLLTRLPLIAVNSQQSALSNLITDCQQLIADRYSPDLHVLSAPQAFILSWDHTR